MHLVTSSLFLSSLSAHLKPTSQELLLRGYLTVCLTWYVGNGRPGFDIPGFFAADTAYPTPPGPFPTPDKKALPEQNSPKAVTPNPWLPIIQTTIVHPDDHLPKLQRALAHYGSLYGTRPAGLPDFTDTELPGADKLDGTLFIRAAGLTAKRMGRVRDGEKPLDFWDQYGFDKN
jgi:Questin oxidase-like